GIRRRLAPLVGNNRRRMELLNSLLFSLPGTPVIYYGDEIGMGDNIYLGDRNGVRTPMQWSADRNSGFSRANPQRLFLPIIIDPEYHYETFNVEAQQQNPSSLLWWMKRLILLRKNYQAFGQGSIEFLHPDNRQVLVFLRRYRDEIILVAANLSRFVNFVELDLASYKGMLPVELFGQTRFPTIGDLPYFLTFGPHAFYWFKLEPPATPEHQSPLAGAEPAKLEVSSSWDEIFDRKAVAQLERALPGYLQGCRWFGGKAKPIRTVKLVSAIPFTSDGVTAHFTTWEVQYLGKTPETYLLPLMFAQAERAFTIRQANPQAVVAHLKISDPQSEGILCDAIYDSAFAKALMTALSRNRRFKADGAELLAEPSKVFHQVAGAAETTLEPTVLKREQSNTSVVYGDRLILKLIRRVTEGLNPDSEISRFLTEKAEFASTPPLAGTLQLARGRAEPAMVGIAQGLVANEGDAWSYSQDSLARYFDEILARRPDLNEAVLASRASLEITEEQIPELARDAIGSFLPSMQLLGQRTGELHKALASDSKNPAFAPEAFTGQYRRSLYQSMRALTDQTLSLLDKRLKQLPETVRTDADKVLKLEDTIFARFRQLLATNLTGMRIRCHGDFHLGQVLFTGKDFVIIDFEGEPARPLSERRMKRSPLRDVAGMLRSFHYAASVKLKSQSVRPDDPIQLKPWARFWNRWVSVAYLKGYLDATAGSVFMPTTRAELLFSLDLYLLEKAMYELGYELNNRPELSDVPIAGILEILQPAESV
ncbi:MAG TPA: putative maltokinase, partial [Candidatus Binatia bacterium]|nr:putative maltokinase [Candidatus Binatia bacterium]